MSDRWTDSLSEYLDHELDDDRRLELERHLGDCSECRATVADLGRVVARAGSLPHPGPKTDLWPAIAARLAPRSAEEAEPAPVPAGVLFGDAAATRRGRGWRISFGWPQLAAAGLAVGLISGAAYWVGTRQPVSPLESGNRSGAETSVAFEPSSPQPSPDVALAEIRRALEKGRGDLDTSTVRVLEQNMLLIERSIAEAKKALDADPRNPYLRQHLHETMQRKVDLLRRATLVASVR